MADTRSRTGATDVLFARSALCGAAAALLLAGCGDAAGSGAAGASGSAGAGSGSEASSSAGSGGAGQGGAGQGGAGSGGGGQGGSGGASAEDLCEAPGEKDVDVSDSDGLKAALEGAAPGTRIRLAAGVYEGNFEGTTSGTGESPILVCGPREAVLDGGSTKSGYVFHLKASRWVLSGFSVTRGKKGIMLDGANENLLTGLLVHDIGDEAIHFRTFSSGNTLTGSTIRDTGKETPGFGEGAYIGSAVSNWDTITGSSDTPDTSDGNKIIGNEFGPGITAEHIDIKEGTTGGEVRGNTFQGVGISGANYADSWIDLKGSGYQIEGNTGFDAPKDGFQTHVAVDGWGNDNVFTKNVANVNGPGFGFSVAKASMGNVVRCDNVVNAAAAGFADVDCVQ